MLRRALLLLGCVAGLLGCGPAGPDPDAGPADDPTLVVVRFDPDGDGFFRMPWPSDARTTPAGTPDMSDFPRRGRALEPPLLEIEANVRGFATMPVIYLGLTAPIGEAALRQGTAAQAIDSPLFLMDLSEEGCGQRLPLEVAFAAEGDSMRDPNVLMVANAAGTVLEPRRPYGLVVRTGFGAEEGRSTPRPPAFDEALRDESGASALSRSLAPLRRCLPNAGVGLDEVAVATVFTTQDAAREMRALRDHVVDPAAVETRPLPEWKLDESWSRRRLALRTYTGLVELPMYQAGEPPYETEGGALILDEAGRPVLQRWEPAPVAVAFDPDAPVEGPRPVLVFMDGTGWTPWSHLRSSWIRESIAAGFVVMSFMPQFHGERAGVTGSVEALTFNVPNASAVRATFRQQAAETSYFLRVVREQIASLPGMPELDVSRPVYGGHSQGALAGALVAGVEDQYRAYVFSGLSAFLTETIIHREDIVDFAELVSLIYRYNGALDRFSPLLQMMQLGGEVVDPHNYAPLWRVAGNHVFVSNGFTDVTTTARGMAHLTLSAPIPPIAPPGFDPDPLGLGAAEPIPLPIAGNTESPSGAPLTIATYLDATEGHGTLYRRPLVRELAIGLWQSAIEGGARLQSLREYQCGDGADEDGDGMFDCADPDCAETPPCVEGVCDDGLDEDSDGAVDCDDADCDEAAACQERACDDGDDDGDGLADCADPDCAERAPCVEERCDDGLDDDGNGAVDCDDERCAGGPRCVERVCSGGADEDRDGAIDCADPDCRRSPACPELLCADRLDDDGDGVADCLDPDCASDQACARPREARCADAVDDDGDRLVDCADPDCALAEECAAGTCADGDLGSSVGPALFDGTLEGRPNRFPPGDCVALGFGGDAPDVSFAFTAPAAGRYGFSTRGSELDTVLSVLADDCEPAGELACDDDERPLQTSALSLELSEGQTVVVVIGAFDPEAAVGRVLLHVDGPR